MTRVNLTEIAYRDSLRAREDAQRADARDARAQGAEPPTLRWWDTSDDTCLPSADLLDGDRVVASIHRHGVSPQGGFDYAVCDEDGTVHSLVGSWTAAKQRAEYRYSLREERAALRAEDEVAL